MSNMKKIWKRLLILNIILFISGLAELFYVVEYFYRNCELNYLWSFIGIFSMVAGLAMMIISVIFMTIEKKKE